MNGRTALDIVDRGEPPGHLEAQVTLIELDHALQRPRVLLLGRTRGEHHGRHPRQEPAEVMILYHSTYNMPTVRPGNPSGLRRGLISGSAKLRRARWRGA